MEINKGNYEAYLLDLWEGNLSEELKVMLNKFLEKYPELDDGDHLNLLSDISITESKLSFDKTSINFDEINSKNYEFFFIAYSEGDLSKDEMNSIEGFLIENPELNNKFLQFNKARLPLETIKYPNKEKLILGKTHIISIPARRWFMGVVAASIVFLIWIKLPIEESPYLYTISQPVDLEIEKYTSDSFKIDSNEPINSVVLRSENKIYKQLFTSNSPIDSIQNSIKIKELDKESLANSESKKQKAESPLKDQNKAQSIDNDLINVSQLKAIEISGVVTSVALVKEIDTNKGSIISENDNQKTPTIVDLTAEYLQRKNILNEERRPNLKGIINNTLTNVNKNEKPIIYIQDMPKTKTTIFQLGSLKIERQSRK
ncbi:hypothetical protein ERX46_04770 [Brumimicrobium glaciale]|uniref:Uncharacterized protein n=1 Tax=Brumimicrobium glaciale TaxID=200475 RepID=A0A4Q4KNT8_9FLAO|nr:hypothetical protein [Brumimicrobium glaciale]RYM34690.1 hypothetical protein ERX46_04770 [Brumimicrobium glaciale]